MKYKLIKSFMIFSLCFLVLIIPTGIFVTYTIQSSWPQETGTITVPGLKNHVEVFKDKWGIPHIYASNQHDLFMAQGYIHAQDRFWQMDFWRHIGSGRLAEIFGDSQVKTDMFLRTLGWSRVAEQELALSDSDTVAILKAYADGVNVYLENHRNNSISLEYAIIKLLNPDYKPEPWKPLHSLTWIKAMAWNLSTRFEDEIERTILLETLGSNKVNQLFPHYPIDNPVIISQSDTTNSIKSNLALKGDQTTFLKIKSLQPAINQIHSLTSMMGQTGNGIGSNSWAISGKRTATGKPILANDPHLGAQMPSIWYEVALHCTSQNDCPYNVSGFSFAGMPGVIIGHDERIAWGLTNVNPNVTDLYIERINPDNLNQYEVNGKWVDMKLVKENIQNAEGESVPITIRQTRHGPIISDIDSRFVNFREKTESFLPVHYAIALKSTGLEVANTFRAILSINKAQNWQEFRIAAKDFDVPSQNLVYADTSGNIGYQMTGKIPIRLKGDGSHLVSGWTDDYEWKNYISYNQLPSILNPADGYIVTANNAVVNSDYPYQIGKDWDYGYRAKRIVEMIEKKNGKISITDVQKMQGDNKNLNAATLVPILLQLPVQNNRLKDALNILYTWDFQQDMHSSASALFETFWKHLLFDTFQDNLPENYLPQGNSRWISVISNLIHKPNSFWWDDRKTSGIENRDDIFLRAFTDAVSELEQSLGKDLDLWKWGDLHSTTFRNATLGQSGNIIIEKLFNRGPFATSGGSSIVNATSWNAHGSFEVTWLPSMRMIVDLSRLQNSLAINTTGQSGHAFHLHYDDMIDLWRNINYHSMLWSKNKINNQHTSHLSLTP